MSELLYSSGKNYTHAIGLSCCFRQWRATHSHCRFLHGYSLQVEFEFQSHGLDERNWVVDFGGLKVVKGWLESMFDHKTVVAQDDPELPTFRDLAQLELIDLVVVEHVGCEAFARMIFRHVNSNFRLGHGVWLQSVTVREHDANWARVTRKPDPNDAF